MSLKNLRGISSIGYIRVYSHMFSSFGNWNEEMEALISNSTLQINDPRQGGISLPSRPPRAPKFWPGINFGN